LENQFLIYGRADGSSRGCGSQNLNNEPEGIFGRRTVCDDVEDLYYTGYVETIVDDRNKFITFCRSCNTST